MPDYRRVFIPGGTYFFTVALLERRLRLLTENIDALREAFQAFKAERPFTGSHRRPAGSSALPMDIAT